MEALLLTAQHVGWFNKRHDRLSLLQANRVSFTLGGAFPIIFILAAEYVSPNLRVIMLSILWTATTLAIMSLAGIAYVVEKRQILMLTMTLPLLLAVLLWR